MDWPKVRIGDIKDKVWIPEPMVKVMQQAHRAEGFSEKQPPTFGEILQRKVADLKGEK